jgi:hypothetical protein
MIIQIAVMANEAIDKGNHPLYRRRKIKEKRIMCHVRHNRLFNGGPFDRLRVRIRDRIRVLCKINTRLVN